MDTSEPKNSPDSQEKNSQAIGPEDELDFLLAMLVRIQEKVPGVKVESANTKIGGVLTAVAIFNGCIWNAEGKLRKADE